MNGVVEKLHIYRDYSYSMHGFLPKPNTNIKTQHGKETQKEFKEIYTKKYKIISLQPQSIFRTAVI